MDLYARLAQSREALVNTYDEILPAEQKANEITKAVNDVLPRYFEGDESVREGLTADKEEIVNSFEKFFGEKLEGTVPEPF